jgi:hypothetical protein
VKLDRRFVDPDLKIVTGLVEPHFMEGQGAKALSAEGLVPDERIVLRRARRGTVSRVLLLERLLAQGMVDLVHRSVGAAAALLLGGVVCGERGGCAEERDGSNHREQDPAEHDFLSVPAGYVERPRPARRPGRMRLQVARQSS